MMLFWEIVKNFNYAFEKCSNYSMKEKMKSLQLCWENDITSKHLKMENKISIMLEEQKKVFNNVGRL